MALPRGFIYFKQFQRAAIPRNAYLNSQGWNRISGLYFHDVSTEGRSERLPGHKFSRHTSTSRLHPICHLSLGWKYCSTNTRLLGLRYDSIHLTSHRLFRSSATLYEHHESKLEKTVKVLKEKQEEQVKKQSLSPLVQEATVTAVAAKKSLGQRIVDEIKHYYHGFRLLFIDIKISARLLWQVMNGYTLSRRERKQFLRTVSDLFRLVPFLVFVIVPFMEFLLPVAVKLFPNMLPSTFQTYDKKQENMKRQLKVKIEMAKFLQDTIEEMGLRKIKKSADAKGHLTHEFSEFMNKIRSGGVLATTEEIRKYSKLFENELTLDNLTHSQLSAVCKLLDLNPIGTTNFLQFQLLMKLRSLRADDKMIQKEGVDALSVTELQQACRARGMRAHGASQQRLTSQLTQWLDLHLNNKIPISLLLLSRALYLPDVMSSDEQLKTTLSQLPESITEEAKLHIIEVEGETDHKAKLNLIKQEEERIKLEKAEEIKVQKVQEAIEKAKKIKKEELQAQAAMLTQEPPVEGAVPTVQDVIATAASSVSKEELVDTAPIVKGMPGEEIPAATEEFTAKDIENIEEVLETLEQTKLVAAKEDLAELKQSSKEYKEDLEDLKVIEMTSGAEEVYQETTASKRLGKSVAHLVEEIDSSITNMDKEKAVVEEIITDQQDQIKDVKEEMILDKQTPVSEPAAIKTEVVQEKIVEQVQEQKRELVSIAHLLEAMRRFKDAPDEMQLKQIAEVLDGDNDGNIEIEHILRVTGLIANMKNIKLTAKQLAELSDLVKKEQVSMESEEKVKENQQSLG
ncbi:PREDICTED: LETM1 and EF-hand domain-containing protein 1, mitochondrial-like [Priapulus caudatus]|uniref:LETM1 and EF-hand domain-containing protein 1, mitochondrial-like n=1 Tax=Priapulus caudatus TaxID=37621 RepID=A0ABM1EHN5_PRICU|nr:PREDICTED: LETM1 and EF-hand domain-containing protein 1, mitochondrial-like [Priapulus caudatus]